MRIELNWIEVDGSIFSLSTREEFDYYTKLANSESASISWQALVIPTTQDLDYFKVTVSNNALYKFTDECVKNFKGICKNILGICTSAEIDNMTEIEMSKNNSDKLYFVNTRILSLNIPKRLLEHSKNVITDFFTEMPNAVEENEWQFTEMPNAVEENEWQLD